jgi:hypothetical protein
MIPIDKASDYSNEKVYELKERIATYHTVIQSLNSIIDRGEELIINKENEDDNIVHIFPIIKNMYNNTKNSKMSYFQIQRIYEEWLDMLSYIIISSSMKVKSKKYKKHLKETLDVCCTIHEPMEKFFEIKYE